MKKENMSSFILLPRRNISLKKNILLFFLLLIPILSIAQDIKISLNIKKTPLSDVLNQIELKSGYSFLIRNNDVDLKQLVSIEENDKTVQEILSVLFKNMGIKFQITGKSISIFIPQNSPVKNNPPAKNNSKKITTGLVTDEKGEPIIGATVLNKTYKIGTITDINGRFSINCPEDGILLISYLGYKSKEVVLTNQDQLIVQLIESASELTEVVVVGYGTQKKATLTGAITTVGSQDLIKAPVQNLATAMVGRLPGLATVQSSGQPGSETPKMRIRGVSTLNGADPLIIVDGVEVSGGVTSDSGGGISGFEAMNMDDVESISILKDASSTAVYGVRGANGVIIINTKQGLKGKPKITASANFGTSSPLYINKTVNSYEWGTYMNEGNANDGVAPAMSAVELEHYRTGDSPILYPSLDVIDYVLKKSAPQQNYNLSINGGTDNVRYFVSAGYLNQTGILKDVGYGFDPNYLYNRLNIRSNIDINFTKTLSGSINIDSRFENKGGAQAEPTNNEFLFKIVTTEPHTSPGIIDGKYIISNPPGDPIANQPYMSWVLRGGIFRSLQTTANTIFSLKQKLDFITKGLSAQGKFSYNSWYKESYTRTINPYVTYTPFLMDSTIYYKQSGTTKPFSYKFNDDNAANKYYKNYFEISLNYARTFGDHSITGLILYNQSKSFYSQAQYRDIPNSYIGFVSRITYDYKNRYLAEFNFGLNGSENFPMGKRYGKFPAFSAGWVTTEENFMKSLKFISHLKIRGSYGTVGNDRIGNDRFLYIPSSFSAVPSNYSTYFGTATATSTHVGLQEGRYANNNITWELAQKANVGFDSKLFNDQLSFNFDLFQEHRSNILTNLSTTPLSAYPVVGPTTLDGGWANGSIVPPVNYAIVDNRGYEIELGWNSKIDKVRYNISASMTYAKNNMTKISEPITQYPWMSSLNQSIGVNFGLIAEGYFNSYDEIYDSKTPYSTFTKTLIPGDIKYKDLNGDMKIDDKDYVPIGYSNVPQKTFTINIGLDYKGFSISALFQGAAEVTFLPNSFNREQFGNSGNAYKWIVNRWTPETRDAATYPVIRSSPNNNFAQNDYRVSSYWLRDASYIRLKNLEIGYEFPTKIMKKLGLGGIKVYVNGQNLATLTRLLYFDPESIGGQDTRYPISRVFNSGFRLTL